MINFNKLRFLLITAGLAIAAVLVLPGCEDDDEKQPPSTGTLNGNVIFHGDWPDSGTVQLSIFENWNNEGTGCWWCAMSAGGPPSYYTHSAHFQDPDPTNTSPADTLSFDISGITLGSYDVVVIGWRTPTQTGNVECDEPVIGMYGAVAGTSDSIPESITFAQNSATQTIEIHVWFDRRLPVAGCNNLGRIEGTVNFSGTWPAAGVAAIITTMPYTIWEPGGIAGYRGRSAMTNQNNLYYSFSQPYGTYFVSFWTNEQPPNNKFLGAYGVVTSVASPPGTHNAASTPIVISSGDPEAALGATALSGPAPHYIAGVITFTGDRPAAGIAVALSLTPTLMGPPAGWYALDPTETVYALTGMAEGTYYALLYENSTSPSAILYGSYDANEDGQADPIVIDASNYGYTGINISN
ncbi:hypothetical protein KJZ99_06200 [bacterium]|nr:hypothetical protein [bacterium]